MKLEKVLKKLTVVIVVLSMSGTVYASVERVLFRMETSQGVEGDITLPIVKGQVFVPFKAMLEQIGMTNFKWELSQSEAVKAHITMQLDQYFVNAQYRNLMRALEIRDEAWLSPLPEQVIKFINEQESVQSTSNEERRNLNKRGIEIDIQSEGYNIGFMIYDYQIINGTMYVPVSEFKNLGIGGITINRKTHEFVIDDQSKEDIAKGLTRS